VLEKKSKLNYGLSSIFFLYECVSLYYQKLLSNGCYKFYQGFYYGVSTMRLWSYSKKKNKTIIEAEKMNSLTIKFNKYDLWDFVCWGFFFMCVYLRPSDVISSKSATVGFMGEWVV
jgi:hypothetical protein